MGTGLTRLEPGVATGGASRAGNNADTPADWRQAVPVLSSRRLTAREVTQADGPTLVVLLAATEVTRFISPLPATIEEFDRFVAWTHKQRAAGQYVCYSVVPVERSTPVGLFQVRSIEPGFVTAEWGFALAPQFWGTGLFVEAARLVLDFAFGTIRVRRLEARASVRNARGNAALRKLGATPEGVLRRSFRSNGEYEDQVLWSILDSDWKNSKLAAGSGALAAGSGPAE